MRAASVKRQAKKVRASSRLDREAWIEGARALFIEGGADRVKVEPLAFRLGVTTGSFYWHFRDREALLDALIDDWVVTNTAGMAEAISLSDGDAERAFEAIEAMWVDERNFSPAYDAAMREFARVSKAAERSVRAVDRKRIDLLRGMFEGLGYRGDRAEVRARVMYYHQVGYYALNQKDPVHLRVRLRPLYGEILRDGLGRRKK